MNIEEKLSIFLDCYDALLMSGKVRTQGEFAQMMGVSRGSVNQAVNGKEAALTDSLVSKAVRLRDSLLGPEIAAAATQSPAIAREEQSGVFIPEKTLELYTSLAKACDRLSAIVDRMMPAAQSGGKNYSADVLK